MCASRVIRFRNDQWKSAMRAKRALYVALYMVLHCAICSEVLAAQDAQERVVTQRDATVAHTCPSKGEATTVRRPIGLDGRRIRPVD